MQGFAPVRREPAGPPFHADWEAHVFVINQALLGRGVYNLDEFRDAARADTGAGVPGVVVLRTLAAGHHCAAGGKAC